MRFPTDSPIPQPASVQGGDNLVDPPSTLGEGFAMAKRKIGWADLEPKLRKLKKADLLIALGDAYQAMPVSRVEKVFRQVHQPGCTGCAVCRRQGRGP